MPIPSHVFGCAGPQHAGSWLWHGAETLCPLVKTSQKLCYADLHLERKESVTNTENCTQELWQGSTAGSPFCTREQTQGIMDSEFTDSSDLLNIPVTTDECKFKVFQNGEFLILVQLFSGSDALTLLCESILALISPSRISCVSSSSRAATVVLKAVAILRISADTYGLKY